MEIRNYATDVAIIGGGGAALRAAIEASGKDRRCTTCILKLNGKSVKSCSTPVEPNSEIQIDPVTSGEVIRDLVVDFNNM